MLQNYTQITQIYSFLNRCASFDSFNISLQIGYSPTQLWTQLLWTERVWALCWYLNSTTNYAQQLQQDATMHAFETVSHMRIIV
jgi:hypothetical protein